MREVLLVLIILLFANMENVSAQNFCDKCRLNKAFKLYGIDSYNDAIEKRDKVKWVRDSSANQEQYFKSLFLESFLNTYEYITIENIDDFKDTLVLDRYVDDVEKIKANFELIDIKKRDSKYREKYHITIIDFKNLISLLTKRSKSIKYDEKKRKEKERADLEKRIWEMEEAERRAEEERKKREQKELIESLNNQLQKGKEEFVKAANSFTQNEKLQEIRDDSGDSLYVEYKEVITLDSTTFSFMIRYNEKAFDNGVYYDERVYDLIEERLLNIKDRTLGEEREIRSTAIGSADGRKVNGLRYSKRLKNFGYISASNVIVNGVNTNLSIDVGNRISNSELAFLRAWNIQDILLRHFGQDYGVGTFYIEDFEGQKGKIDQRFRTTGFIIVTETFSQEMRDKLATMPDDIIEHARNIFIKNDVIFENGSFVYKK